MRPHPYSYTYEPDFMNEIESELKELNVTIDKDVSGLKSMAKADIMVSDVSGVRFDFSIVFGKSTISLETSAADTKNIYEYGDLPDYSDHQLSFLLGIYLTNDEVDLKIEQSIKELINKKLDTADLVANLDRSTKYISDILRKLHQGV